VIDGLYILHSLKILKLPLWQLMIVCSWYIFILLFEKTVLYLSTVCLLKTVLYSTLCVSAEDSTVSQHCLVKIVLYRSTVCLLKTVLYSTLCVSAEDSTVSQHCLLKTVLYLSTVCLLKTVQYLSSNIYWLVDGAHSQCGSCSRMFWKYHVRWDKLHALEC
jgi:hypothetical protein